MVGGYFYLIELIIYVIKICNNMILKKVIEIVFKKDSIYYSFYL